MTWNYRVIRTQDADGVTYSVHECHYDGDDISRWTENPVTVSAEDLDGIEWMLSKMRDALTRPVLEIHDGKLRVAEEEPANHRNFATKFMSHFGTGYRIYSSPSEYLHWVWEHDPDCAFLTEDTRWLFNFTDGSRVEIPFVQPRTDDSDQQPGDKGN